VSLVRYRRNLPHIFPKHTPIFVTWRLKGSVPMSVVIAARKSADTTGKRFVSVDRYLDTNLIGPRWLGDRRIAEMLCIEIERGAAELPVEYVLHEYVVMPNHVHLFITPVIPMHEIMQRLKGSSARFANTILGREDKAFWQQESFDHFSRNVHEFGKIRGYIARNPVKVGLATTADEWPWSSAHRRKTSSVDGERR